MRHSFLIIVLCAALMLWFSEDVYADIEYYPDPVYPKLSADDIHPMDDMVALARKGDVRAQFILGDMYAKGKGGFAKDLVKAYYWFEESAINGYNYSFIRLAVLAKNENKPLYAWQWYTLASKSFKQGKEREFVLAARHHLIVDEKLSAEDIWRAKDSMDDWLFTRGKRLCRINQTCSETSWNQ